VKIKLPKILQASHEDDHADLFFATAGVEIEAAASNQKTPRVAIEAYTGGIMAVAGFGNVVIDLAGLKLPRQVPLLADHDGRLQGIAGHGRARIEAGKLHVEGTLTSKTEAGQTIIDLAREQFEFQSSVGVRPGKRRFIRRGESVSINGRNITASDGGFLLIEQGELREVSILAMGADAETQVSIAARRQHHGATNMSIFSRNKPTDTDDRAELRQRIEAAEKFTTPDGGWKDRAGEVAEIRAAFIAGELEADDFNKQLGDIKAAVELDHLRASRPSGGVIQSHQRQSGIDDKHVSEAGLMLMCGYESAAEKIDGGRAIQAARDLRLTNLRAWDDFNSHITGTPDVGVKASGFSTASIGVLMSTTPKMLLAEFEQNPASCDSLADWRPLPDFKEQSLYRLIIKGGLDEVAGDGEIKHGTLSEFDTRVQLGTFARMFTLTRKALVNDDVSALASIPRVLVMEAARLRGEKFAALLTANAGSFFGSGNSNNITDTLSTSGLNEALVKLRTQTDADDRALGLSPTALLVHPSNEATARAIVSSMELARDTSTDSQAPTGNPYRALNLRVEVEPRLDTTTEWYLFARPTDAGVVIGTLNGQRTPIVEQPDAAPNVLGQIVRGYYDFAITLAEPRAIVRSTGAG